MKNCKLYLALAFIIVLLGCNDKAKSDDFSGYWRDSTGMALFQVKAESSENWTLSSSLGALTGKKIGNSIRGTTDLQDSFAMEVSGNTAVYSVLGVTIDYFRITKDEYDSLTNELQSSTAPPKIVNTP